jgi:hypothetical protein
MNEVADFLNGMLKKIETDEYKTIWRKNSRQKEDKKFKNRLQKCFSKAIKDFKGIDSE